MFVDTCKKYRKKLNMLYRKLNKKLTVIQVKRNIEKVKK